MEKIKDRITTSLFLIIILGFAGAHLFLPDQSLSYSERRRLAQMPGISVQTIFSGEFSDQWETYCLDQFPMREGFRTIKAIFCFYLLGQSDNNGVYLIGNNAFKMEHSLQDSQIFYGADKINAIYAELLEGMRVYYAIIPDKNYFVAGKNGYPCIDYERLVRLMKERVRGPQYIDIFDTLMLTDYYHTDAHWRQEKLFRVRDKIASAFGVSQKLTPENQYKQKTLSPFYGVYSGQSALPIPSDELVYLTSTETENAYVTGAEFEGERGVYLPELVSGIDGYDVYLSGAQAIITITCPNARSDRELIIFRDSFASSLAPLFTGAYSRITLIDLRYVSAHLLTQYVNFNDQDILFLYSTSLLNSAMLLK